MQYAFGTGALFGVPTDGGTPVQFGALTGVTLEFDFATADMHDMRQFPVANGRGLGGVRGHAETAIVRAGIFNQLFFGRATVAGAVRVDANGHTYISDSGERMTIDEMAFGELPQFKAVFTESFQGKQFTLVLNLCLSAKLVLSTKYEDFTIPAFEFEAYADVAGEVGIFSLDDELDLPPACMTDPFGQGLGPFTKMGDTSIFSIQPGGRLRVGAQNGGSAYIERGLEIAGPVVSMAGEVMITDLAVDDSCGMYVIDALGNRFGFAPRLAAANDNLRRAVVDYTSGYFPVGTEALLEGVLYRFTISLSPDYGQSTVEIKRVDTGEVVAFDFIPGLRPPIASSIYRFFIDSTQLTCVTYYGSIAICSHEADT